MFKKNWISFLFFFYLTYITSICSAGYLDGLFYKERPSLFDIIVTDKRFTKLASEIEKHDLTSQLKKVKAGTLFAPVNKAFDDIEQVTREQILYHLIPVAIKSGELWDGRLLGTEAYQDDIQQVLKVTKTSVMRDIIVGTGVESNRANVIEADIDASNGVLHTVDRLLSFPADLDTTLGLDKDLQDFNHWVDRASLNLKRAKGYTIFASKSVFGDQLNDVEKDYLDSNEGRHDLARVLNHQITPKLFYSGDLKEGESKIKTVEGSEDLDILVKGDTITVNGVKMVKSNLLSSNGVIHVLESPILPKNKDFLKLNARKALNAIHATRFIKLFDDHGLGGYLDDEQDEQITLLAPPNDALDEGNVPSNQMKAWLEYHIIRGRYRPSDLVNGQLLETESHNDLGETHHQRIPVTVTEQDPNIYGNNRLFIEKQSIQFGKSRVIKDPIETGEKTIIYPLARSLSLPRDLLSRLPVNLELSTFVASLYASGADETIERSHGITLFAPSNEAFGRLGLLAKHLLQLDSKEKLERVVKYHAVRDLYYENSTEEGEHQAETLINTQITLNKTQDGMFIRGSGAADGADRAVIGKVVKSDILSSNGVIHIIDRVQLPDALKISNRDLLSAEGTSNLLALLEHSHLTQKVLEGIDGDQPYTILAPSDRAFAKINLAHLKGDPEKLAKFAKLHIIPLALPPLDAGEIKHRWWFSSGEEDQGREIGYTGTEFPSLLSKDTVLVISKNVGGGYSVKIKGSSQDSAEIVDIGRSSSGGGVLEIDRVLVPPEEAQKAGLAWWQITLIVLGSLLGFAILAWVAYYMWQWYQSRRGGYHSLGD
ncbi:hypothetical protein G6F46_004595 [Rhizopus delemar]|uniref:FAS1 domain-containing protein n=3 Tax=Rhizopus TaxID=4842 RepID=I1BN52_RHIO9|nr:hypothetical protein RO3G_02336 [Rhizopus delemar RA 99-880]KAG1458057.1 hypothetical protein G6F55_005567 [Rhizopus delemar]KAG1542806.1 hypothetical protein G6F51_007059 [Rhizopus arrhizus]KAG1500081.1 hypothetical protein G6F54_003960 [Rhizopus delemar]KAG1518404.1 hypothetical protein G6F53_000622 [Rhizopus delemar]|eukprot:EIE77632.1 hypothetical protein RO3G_02336 [Rhizopus delemar RA 99-880]